MLTKHDLQEIRNLTKDEIQNATQSFATKDDLKSFATKDDIKKATIGLPSRDDVRQIVQEEVKHAVRLELKDALQDYPTRKEMHRMGEEIIEVIETTSNSKADNSQVEKLKHRVDKLETAN